MFKEDVQLDSLSDSVDSSWLVLGPKLLART